MSRERGGGYAESVARTVAQNVPTFNGTAVLIVRRAFAESRPFKVPLYRASRGSEHSPSDTDSLCLGVSVPLTSLSLSLALRMAHAVHAIFQFFTYLHTTERFYGGRGVKWNTADPSPRILSFPFVWGFSSDFF